MARGGVRRYWAAATGGQAGNFMGVAATGRRLVWHDIVVTRYENGMIAEEWGESGLAGLLHTQKPTPLSESVRHSTR